MIISIVFGFSNF